jgi:hypothetical protein
MEIILKKPLQDENDWWSEIEKIQSTFKPRSFKRFLPKSDFPEIDITIPDKIESPELAPLFDVHCGSPQQDEQLLDRHLEWIAETPNVFSWDGGDITENITDFKMGHTPASNEDQVYLATKKLAVVQHKLFFKLAGNHEDRTYRHTQTSSSRRIADNIKVPHFGDYVFANLKWRDNNFRLLTHHGAGGGTTPGSQRNSARKELMWFKPDILWTGHLHAPLADIAYLTDIDQKTGRVFERSCVVLISPSYLRYHGGYAAKMRLPPSIRGLSVCKLQEDGRIDITIHSRGKRL